MSRGNLASAEGEVTMLKRLLMEAKEEVIRLRSLLAKIKERASLSKYGALEAIAKVVEAFKKAEKVFQELLKSY